jgi:phosphate transport system substrate-binding protein
MDRRRKVLFSILNGVLILFAVWILDVSAQDDSIMRFSGSKYMYFDVTDSAKYYLEHHPNSNVEVSFRDYYSVVSAILEKSADAIMVLGKLDDDMKQEASEQGIQLQEQLVGWGAVVLVVDPHNPVNELSVEQVRKIFLGEYKNWKDVGGIDEPIVTMSRDDSVSGTEKFFKESVLNGQPMGQQTVRSFDHDIVRAVWKRKGSIADARYAEAMRGRIKGLVKVVSIKEDKESLAIMPSVDTLRSHTYPMSAPMYLYFDTKSKTNGLNDFVQFCARRGLSDHYAEAKSRPASANSFSQ